MTLQDRRACQLRIEGLLEALNADGTESAEMLAALVFNGPKNRYQHKLCAWEKVEDAYRQLLKALENAEASAEGEMDIEERKADQYA